MRLDIFFFWLLGFIAAVFYPLGVVINEELFVFLSFFVFLEFFAKNSAKNLGEFLDLRAERIYLNVLQIQELYVKSLVLSFFYYARVCDVRKVSKNLAYAIYLELAGLATTFEFNLAYFKVHLNFYVYCLILELNPHLLRAVVVSVFFANFSTFLGTILAESDVAKEGVSRVRLVHSLLGSTHLGV